MSVGETFITSMLKRSLVSKSWRESSRRRHFPPVYIDLYTCQSWLDNISPANIGLLRHVRSLEYSATPLNINSDHPRGVYGLRNYFPAFCQLDTLALSFVDVEPTITELVLGLSIHPFLVGPHKFLSHVGCVRCARWIFSPYPTS